MSPADEREIRGFPFNPAYIPTSTYKEMVIVTNIWQKLSSFEHRKTLIVSKYLAAIFTHYWRNLAYRHTYLAKPYFVL